MAYIEKRGDGQYRVQVRRRGFATESQTFCTRNEAETWALTVESEMKRGVYVSRKEAESTTLKDAFEDYAKQVTILKKGKDRELARIKRWQSRPIAACYLASIRPKDLATFRDERRAEGVAENTIRLDLALVSHLFEVCRKDWGIEVDNPVRKMRLPGGSKSRERRLKDQEEHYLLEGMKLAAARSPLSPALIELDIETGMRQSELLKMEWSDIDYKTRTARLDETKSGDPRDVPLSPRAIEILKGMPRPIEGGRIFDIGQDRLIRAFKQACAKGQAKWCEEHPGQPLPPSFLEDLKFHDLRHEAASRWASVLEAQELAKMFGWRTLQMALRYYHPTGESLADKLHAANSQAQ